MDKKVRTYKLMSETIRTLKILSAAKGRPMGVIIDDAVAEYEKKCGDEDKLQ